MRLPIKKMTTMGLLLTVSILLGYVEHLVPVFLAIPGAKLGLGNLLVLLLIFSKDYKIKDVALFQLMRILLSSILFASMFSFFYSLSGAVFSLAAMVFVKNIWKFDVVLTSIVGGIFHNIGQTVMATIVISRFSFLYYLPMLLICGLLAGLLMGILSDILIKRGLL